MSVHAATFTDGLPIPEKKRRKKSAPRARTAGVLTKSAATQRRPRTSQILRDLLANNPDVQEFTVDLILREIGITSFGSSLMFFAIPEMIPIPGLAAIMVLPTGAIALQMIGGKRQIVFPEFLRKRTVSRKALAGAIAAVLPVLEKSETVTKPRWKWATDAKAQRILGIFVFLLALSIAFPMPGFNLPQAIGIFTIGLGLVEQDGMIVCLGVIIGLLGMLLLGAVVFGVGSLLGFGGR